MLHVRATRDIKLLATRASKWFTLSPDSNIFAFMTHLNFQLENEIVAFKSIFKRVFHKKMLSVLKIFR